MTWRRRLVHWLGAPSVRAIRGATTVVRDDPDAMREAVRELLGALRAENQLARDEVVSAVFTVTPDLQCAFPAAMAREMGWGAVPLLCASEIAVAGGLPRCLRVLLHVERCWGAPGVRHVYLGAAAALRPDLLPDRSAPEVSAARGIPSAM
jgi:chorismate mutase